jgi:hypothetical protein
MSGGRYGRNRMFLKVLSWLGFLFGVSWSGHWPLAQMSSLEQQKLIQSAILSTQSDQSLVSQLRARALSRQIHKAGRCFQIDPFVFTALVWRESNFRQQSKSPTGAVGLTQLTRPGILEVMDQLAQFSPRKSELIRQQMHSCYPMILSSIPKYSNAVDVLGWKKRVLESQELSLVFGAVLLKTYFKGNYLKALERYNGEPEIKFQFAREVMALSSWISSSFRVIPETGLENSKFLASIQDL